MKKSDITIGATYTAKVSNRLVPVRIDAEHASGGWDATNIVTGKTVHIKTAQRLRAPHADPGTKTGRTTKATKPKRSGSKAASSKGATSKNATSPASSPSTAKGAAKATRGVRKTMAATQATDGDPKAHGDVPSKDEVETKKTTKPAAPKRLSLLDAAATVLAKAKEPMGCKEIVEGAMGLGWTTSGKTPHATLYAAMSREIAKKGKASRFVKVERGRFASAG